MRTVLLFVHNGMADFESSLVCHLLATDGNVKITTFSYERNWVTTRSGIRIIPDLYIDEVALNSSIEALIIPGGRPPYSFDNRLMEIIRMLHGRETLIAAICMAPLFLAHAGILQDKKFSTSGTAVSLRERDIADPFPWENCVDRRVCVDGNVITAVGDAFCEFAIAVCTYLNVYTTKEDVAELKEAFGLAADA